MKMKYLIHILFGVTLIITAGCNKDEKIQPSQTEFEMPSELIGEWYCADNGTGDDIFEEIPFGNPIHPRYTSRMWIFDQNLGLVKDVWYKLDKNQKGDIKSTYELEWNRGDIKYNYGCDHVNIYSFNKYTDAIFKDYSTKAEYKFRFLMINDLSIPHFLVGPAEWTGDHLKSFLFIRDSNFESLVNELIDLSYERVQIDIDGEMMWAVKSLVMKQINNIGDIMRDMLYNDEYSVLEAINGRLVMKVFRQESGCLKKRVEYHFKVLKTDGVKYADLELDGGLSEIKQKYRVMLNTRLNNIKFSSDQ